MKTCSNCKEIKNENEFSVCNRLKDGLNNECKLCNNKRHLEYRNKNKEKEKARRRLKYLKNKEKEIKQVSEYKKRKEEENPKYKIIRNIRDRHSKAVKNAGKLKNFRTTDLLGCDAAFLKEYIENKFTEVMTWENYGKVWNIDHIFPLSKVDWNNKMMVKKVCHYTNLQPLLCEDNIKKSNKFHQ
jgi:hypothetical protein